MSSAYLSWPATNWHMVFDMVCLALGSKNSGFLPVLSHSEAWMRSEEHTSELQSLMRISYAVFCLKKKTPQQQKEKNIITLVEAKNRAHTIISRVTPTMQSYNKSN